MRILLLSPPCRHFSGEPKHCSPPLGLAYIAAVLEGSGYAPKIVDCALEGFEREYDYGDGTRVFGLRNEEVVDIVDENRPDVIGISCVFSNIYPVVDDISRMVKERFPNSIIVLGGTHPTVMAEEIACKPHVDFVVRGEGEYAFLQLMKVLSEKRSFDQVSNLTWSENGRVRSTPQEFISDLDDLPLPARHLLNLDGYIEHGNMQGQTGRLRATTLITSRGCPAQCVFCSIHAVWGRKYRAHSSSYVLNEIRELRQRYGIDHLVIEDDNFTLNKKRAERILLGLIDEHRGISWTAPNGVAIWALNEKLIGLVRESNCKRLSIAIESGVQETLDGIVNKPLKLEKVKEIVRLCNDHGIETTAFFVIGLPGETLRSIRESALFAENIPTTSISISIATPYPGTALHKICKENGYIDESLDVTRLMTRVGQITTPEFGPEDLQSIIRRTHFRRTLKHPVGTTTRLLQKLTSNPKDTINLILRFVRAAN